MHDLTSRRQAVDALMERFKRVPTNAIIAKDTIKNLPSVQPILTCDGCRYDGYYKHMRRRNCIRKERDLYEPE